jgi:gliding motility-associated-like protein
MTEWFYATVKQSKMKGLLQKIASIAVLMVLSLGLSAQTTAQFSTNNTSGCSPLVVIFTDQSTGNPTNWRWDFGNSNGSIQQNPSAIYLNPGTYTVSLIASGPGGIDTVIKTQLITVFRNPDAKFVANRTTGCIPAPISFTDISVPGDAALTSWIWDFGDGSTSTQQNPTHTYTTPGTYTVTLLARDANGCKHEFTRPSYITIMPKPTVAFTGTPINGCNIPHTVNFNNTTTGGSGFTYAWTFGDGSTSTQQNPSHTYTAGGNYTVRLVATNSAGCSDTLTRNNYVSINNIVANFSVNRTNPCVGQNVTYTSNSPGAVWWRWSFGDGNTSTSENPVRSYSTPGLYSVTLIVRNSNGCYDTITRADYIDVKPRPVTNFTAAPTAGCEVPFTVQFNNTTVDGNTYFWEFGDGTTSTAQNPSHTYTSPGTYTVRLVATSINGCTHSRTRNDYITVQLPTVAFTANVREGCIPLAVQFTDQSSANNGIIGWSWDFGDGSTSTVRNPSHTYTTVGRFDVTLTITTASGCTRTITYPQYIRAGEQPTVEFTATPRQTCLFFPVSFTDLSSPGDFWFWQFGDGGTSFDQNPVYQYGDTGLFTVTLIAGENGCYDTLVKPDYIRIFPPRASFNTLYSCSDPYSVSFTNTSLGGHVWLWKFGTGDTAITRNANYTYPSRGDYTVTLIVWDTIGGCLDSSQALVQIREPIAAFTANDTIGCVNLPVTFTNTATDAFSYQWDFGNGQTSTDPNPSVLYQIPGVYTVRLIVRDIHNCPDTFIRTNYITALGAFANFDADTLTGCTPLNVHYQDLSTSFMGNIVAWNWNLGAGQTSIQQNPSASYTVPGNYTISLTVTDDNGCIDTRSRVNFIVPTYPTPAFYSDDTLVCLGGPVQFTNTSSGSGMTYAWAFGDGTTSTATNPTHTFADTGRYTITLQVFDINGCDSTTVRNQYIRVVQPTAHFVTDTLGANCPPLLVNFANQSSADVTSWLYNFGNGSTSTLENPTHIYTTPGVYYPTLTITNSIGCTATYNLPDSIVVGGPTGGFIYNQITFCAPFEVEFYAQGTNPAVTHIWDFGDGSVSVDDDTATHYYATPGTFNPQLILDDNMGCVISLPTISPIFAAIVNANFVSDVTYMCRPGVANFTDLSSGVPGIVAWQWDFGDGNTSTSQNPSHYYAATGSYDVTLIATNAVGCSDTLFRPGYIRVMQDPIALFTVNTQNACFPATINFTNQSTADTTISSILWVFDDGTTSTLQNPSRNYANPGTYNVQLMITTVMGCKDTFALPISLSVPPAAAAGLDLAICIGQSETLSGTGGVTYLWSPAAGLSATNIASPVASPTVTTDYVLLVTDANGCQDRDTVRVTVNPLPSPTATGGTICVSGSAQLNANGGVSYAWNNSATLSNSAIRNPQATPTATTTYNVTVTDANGCINTGSTTITVNPLPIVTIHPDTLLCSGESVQLFATGGAGYSWGPSAGLNCLNCANPIATPSVNTTYTAIVTNTFGCIDSAHVRVNLNAVDARFSTSDTTACVPTTVQFNDLSVADSTIVAWGWIFGDGATSFAQNPSHTYTTAGVYTAQLQVTTSTGCIDTTSLVININALPAVAAGPDRTICINDTATLLGTGGVIYQWSPAGSLSDANIASPQAFPTNTTTYGLTVTDANGCQGTSQVKVNVNPLPVVTTTPSQELCNGDELQLNATGGVGYLWTPASGLSCITCADPIANPFSPTNLIHTYTVQVTDTNGCINAGSTTITRLLLPGIALNPDTIVCFGNAVEISGGTPLPFNYLWEPSIGLACDTCATTIATPDTTTTYTLTATGANGCPRSEDVTITVNPLPIVVTSPDTTICHNQTVELTASGGVDYVWTPTQGITCGNACNMVIAAPDSSVTYSVLVTDVNGCQSAAEIDIVVHQLEAIFSLSDSSACTPQNVTLFDQSSGDNPIVSWMWNLVDGGLANTQNTTVTYSTPGRREIVLLIQDSYGCIDTAMQVVDMLPTPEAIGGPDTTICYGQVAQLNGFGGQIFVWSGDQTISDPNIADPTVKPTTTTEYFLRTEFHNGCRAFDTVMVTVNALPIPAITGDTVACFGDSLRFTATGGTDYVWSPATNLTTAILPSTTAYAAQDITYTVLVTDANGCAAVDSIVLKVNPVPVIVVSPNVEICLGESADLEVSGALDYGWGPDQDISCLDCTNPIATPTESITYVVVGYNEFGCSTLDTVRVNVRPVPSVQTIEDVTMCNSEALELTTDAIGATGFNWTANGQPDATTQNPMVTPTGSTTYIVEAYNQYGCNDFDTMNVKVIETILTTVSDGAVICDGQNVNLNINVLESGLSDYTITWLPASMFNNPNRLSQTFFPGESMTVQVAINSEGCAADTQSINIVVNSLPTVDLGPNRTVLMGEYVTLNANTTGNIAEYYWSPNDSLDCSDCDNVHFNAWGSNTYNVFVTDVNGCTADDNVSVKVLTTCEQDIFVPNSFSPNRDSHNDVLYVRSHSFESIKVFRIFDRWGNLVFETNDIKQGWNGTYHNSMVDPGVFVYYLEGTCPNGGDVFLKGNVTVLR